MLAQDSLEQAVRAAGIDIPPVFLEEAGSTNLEARALADAGAPEWTLVAAGHQTAGRGRMGRRWVSAPGKSLLFSLLLRPVLPPEDAALLTLGAAMIMAGSCRTVTRSRVEVGTKWPNDLVVGDRKVGGILAEAQVASGVVDHAVLGIGVNVSLKAEDLPVQLRASATSLVIEGAWPEPDPASLLEEFLRGFRIWYSFMDASDWRRQLMVEYRRICRTFGKMVRATTTDGTTIEGRATSIDDQGNLRVQVGRQRRTVAFGEIVHLD